MQPSNLKDEGDVMRPLRIMLILLYLLAGVLLISAQEDALTADQQALLEELNAALRQQSLLKSYSAQVTQSLSIDVSVLSDEGYYGYEFEQHYDTEIRVTVARSATEGVNLVLERQTTSNATYPYGKPPPEYTESQTLSLIDGLATFRSENSDGVFLQMASRVEEGANDSVLIEAIAREAYSLPERFGMIFEAPYLQSITEETAETLNGQPMRRLTVVVNWHRLLPNEAMNTALDAYSFQLIGLDMEAMRRALPEVAEWTFTYWIGQQDGYIHRIDSEVNMRYDLAQVMQGRLETTLDEDDPDIKPIQRIKQQILYADFDAAVVAPVKSP